MINNQNGHHAPSGPMFEVATQDGVNTLRASQIIEMLEANAIQQGKVNLAIGPVFRKVVDDFREWSKVCEPGNTFQAPEVRLKMVRLSCCSPICTSLSDAARKKMAEQKEPAPRILVE